jgi:hypothetical protein
MAVVLLANPYIPAWFFRPDLEGLEVLKSMSPLHFLHNLPRLLLRTGGKRVDAISYSIVLAFPAGHVVNHKDRFPEGGVYRTHLQVNHRDHLFFM